MATLSSYCVDELELGTVLLANGYRTMRDSDSSILPTDNLEVVEWRGDSVPLVPATAWP